MVLMEALDHQRKHLVLILVKQTQNFAPFCVIMSAIVIYLLMDNKPLTLKSIKTMLTFQFNLISKAFLMDLVLLSLEK